MKLATSTYVVIVSHVFIAVPIMVFVVAGIVCGRGGIGPCMMVWYGVYRTRSEDVDETVVRRRDGIGTTPRLRRTSVPIFGQKNKNDNGDDSDSTVSLHRDPLHRRNMFLWRDHWQPTAIRPSNDNNNDNDNSSKYSTSDTLR